MRLQRISFGRSDIPPSQSGGDCRGALFVFAAGQRPPCFNLELGVLRPTERDVRIAAQRVRWDAPPTTVAHDHGQVVAALRIEALDEPVPALVTTPRAHRDVPA